MYILTAVCWKGLVTLPESEGTMFNACLIRSRNLASTIDTSRPRPTNILKELKGRKKELRIVGVEVVPA